MRSFDRWRRLTRDERRLTVKSALVVAGAAASLRVLGIERTLRLASRPVRRPATIVIADVVAAVDRAGRYVPGGTCLPKSLALAWLLRGSGVAATVSIGVSTAAGFQAHAWVECAGVAITAGSSQFRELRTASGQL